MEQNIIYYLHNIFKNKIKFFILFFFFFENSIFLLLLSASLTSLGFSVYKPYFIVTSNGEGHFSLAGLESERIYEIEGNWFSMQCAHRCHDTLYPSMDMIKKMATAQKNGGITSEIVPKCPVCGENMQINLALDNSFIPDFEGPKRFQSFIKQYHGKSLLVLELGIGWRNQLIKPTLMNIVNQEPNATYVTVNKGEIYITDEIADKSFGLDGDMKEILTLLKEKMSNI